MNSPSNSNLSANLTAKTLSARAGDTISPAFALHDTSVSFAATAAVDGVSLEIPQGDRVALVGPSGSGKTTLLRLLNATLSPTEGLVEAFGDNLAHLTGTRLRHTRQRIGFVHQDYALVPNLRVLQNVLSGQSGSRGFWRSMRDLLFASRTDTRNVYGLLKRVGIEDKIYERTDRLSGGQQQRVAIARALFQQPRALLADEPVSSVDPARARDTVDLLVNLAREQELTLIVSLHNVDLAREFFPRLVGLRNGRIAFDKGTADTSDAEFRGLYELEQAS